MRSALPIALLLIGASPQRPPPPAPIVDCFPGPWIVFFARGSAVLDREARSVLDRVVAIDRDVCGGHRLGIVGHIDDGERRGLDRERARAVRTYLRPRGVRRFRLNTVGATDPRGGDKGTSRRVEIFAGVP